MSRLNPGSFSYGSENPPISGLRQSQMRSGYDRTHNSGWYNRQGVKIGWGDLNGQDFVRIADELEDGEAFIILSESDSYWNTKGSPFSNDGPDEITPGQKYVLDRARFAITGGVIYEVLSSYSNSESGPGERYGAPVQYITRQELYSIIG